MGLVFRKSIKIANGLRLNVSKSGVSLTAGKKGMHYTINSKGKSTASVGLPGTGLSYRKSFDTFGGLSSLFGGNKKEEKVKTKTTKKISGDSLTRNIDNSAPITTNSDDIQKLNDYNAYIKQIKTLHVNSTKSVDWKSLALASVPNNISDDDKLKWQNDITLAKNILNKDVDSYLEVMQKYSSLNDISTYGSDFEFGVSDKDILSARFEVKIKDVIPSFGFKQNDDGSISDFKLKSSTYNDLAQDYVCSCSIRIAREVFALLPVDFVLVNAEEEMFDSSTGNNEQTTIMSILYMRDGFNNINFELIDPSDFCARFKENMSFTKTGGFKPVKEIDVTSI